jgi:hypothetical protein
MKRAFTTLLIAGTTSASALLASGASAQAAATASVPAAPAPTAAPASAPPAEAAPPVATAPAPPAGAVAAPVQPADGRAPREASGPPPRPAASGFQAAFRTGLLVPFGEASGKGNDSLGRRYAWQIPFAIDLGARFAESFFAGVYLGFGFGSTGSDAKLENACDDDDEDGENDIVCSVWTLRAGIEGNYSFSPAGNVNPWVGYGIGYEASIASYTDREQGYSETTTSSGITWAQLSAGIDFRKAVGIGPFLEVSIGEFRKTTTEIDDETFRLPMNDRALHAWIMIGGRLVTNP